MWYYGNGNVNGHGNSIESNAMYVCNGNIWEYRWRLGYFLMTLRCNRWDIRHILSLRYLGDICVHIIHIYMCVCVTGKYIYIYICTIAVYNWYIMGMKWDTVGRDLVIGISSTQWYGRSTMNVDHLVGFLNGFSMSMLFC